jgi:hypothetical protein
MTNKNKKRRPPSGYRAPQTAQGPRGSAQPPRRGIFGSLFAPRATVDTDMPKMGTSVGRGFITAAGTPGIVVAIALVVYLEWAFAVLFGFQGPFSNFVNALAIPPVGTSFDFQIAQGMFGVQGGLFAVLGFVALRGVVVALFTGAIVDVLQTGTASRWSLVRGMRAIPTAIATSVASMGLVTVAIFIGPLLGLGLGALLQVAALVAGIYLFVFAPTIAVAEGRRMPECMSRSIRAGRMPGAGNLGFAMVYVLPTIALLVAPGKPGSGIGVNPTVGAWIFVLSINLLQVSMLAAFSFRYLSIADEVPEPAREARPARPARTR